MFLCVVLCMVYDLTACMHVYYLVYMCHTIYNVCVCVCVCVFCLPLCRTSASVQ